MLQMGVRESGTLFSSALIGETAVIAVVLVLCCLAGWIDVDFRIAKLAASRSTWV